MKLPANWTPNNTETPTNWSGAVKGAVAWAGSSIVKTVTAGNWSPNEPKVPGMWDSGQWLYDSYLAYDNPISYDGDPKPTNTKIPSNWATL